ncbi:MAG TPA: hypothetical protein VHM19_01875, partial [Polyangiales bacterium]|nr:hypothetical protein [Polyangiales bacterium]
YVIATSYGARSLRVTATFSAATPASPNQSCRAAVDVSEGGRFPGDFIDVADSTSGCGVVGSPDLYYALTLPGTRDVELAAQNDDGAPLALRVQSGGCSALGATRLCDAQLPAQARLHELPKGTYTITVSGPASREVPFTLDVAVLPPTAAPPGDRCQAPLTLALDEKKQITFSDKQDDVATSCQRFGPDAVLALHVPKATDLSFELDAGDPLAVLSLQSACGDPGSELSCRAGQPLQTRVHDVPAGDYFVVVEAPAAASATVKVTKLPISPVVLVTGNENCANAFDVPETGGLFVGDTTNLLDDYSAPCGAGAKSADAVYRLTLTEARHVVATIDAEFDSVLNRMTDDRVGDEACTDTPSDACDDDSGTGSQAVLDEKLDPGTYYYVVDGFKRDNAGRYLFDVTVTDK